MAPHAEWTLINTRPRHQAEELTRDLRALGFRVLEIPAVEIIPVPGELERARAKLFSAKNVLVVFTSANAVKVLLDFLANKNPEAVRALITSAAVAVIGPKTRSAAEVAGFKIIFQSEESNSDAFGRELKNYLASATEKYQQVIFLRGNLASTELPENIKSLGLDVENFPIYETAPRDFLNEEREKLQELLTSEKNSLFVFTSSEAVRVVADVLASEKIVSFQPLRAAVIGPKTAETAEANGFEVVARPSQATAEALAQVIKEYLA